MNKRLKSENRKILLFSLFFAFILPAYSFEDVIISSDSRLSDIKIEYNDIINVYPLVTISNDKKVLIIEPLKTGSSRFIVTKDKKEQVVFSVKVNSDETFVNAPEGFDVLPVDIPSEIYEYEFDLDEPPEAIWTK